MSRKLAREAAFKALFQLDFNYEAERRLESEELAITTMIEDAAQMTSKKDFAYVEETVKGTRAKLEEIDALITTHLKDWTLERLMAADRNILRLAVYELKFVDEPLSKKIIINEAVELAKRYGTDDSSRFVNGILNSIAK